MTHATDEQLTTALIRARMCHTLADRRGLSADAAFTIGLLSGIADLINQSVTTLARSLPLAPDIAAALTRHEGPLGDVLATVRAYENTNTDTADDLASAYLGALAWSNRTLAPVSVAGAARV
jgi:EAL and modified HD-GYP domain-containing signal transduction protein